MKLCPCKKEGLARALLSESKGVLWHEELFCNTIDMLENFCVCEKKEVWDRIKDTYPIYQVDCCYQCFQSKLIPFIESQKIKPTV